VRHLFCAVRQTIKHKLSLRPSYPPRNEEKN
jgi:hypothetical protein